MSTDWQKRVSLILNPDEVIETPVPEEPPAPGTKLAPTIAPDLAYISALSTPTAYIEVKDPSDINVGSLLTFDFDYPGALKAAKPGDTVVAIAAAPVTAGYLLVILQNGFTQIA